MFNRQPTERDLLIAARIRTLRRICGVLAGFVAAYAVATWFLVEGLTIRWNAAVPREVPVVLTMLAMVLIMLSSRLRTSLLRGAFPRTPGIPIDLERFLAAYQRATLASFAALEAAALVGVLIALLSGTVFYGIFLCLAAGFAMFTRWPRERDADRLASGRRSP